MQKQQFEPKSCKFCLGSECKMSKDPFCGQAPAGEWAFRASVLGCEGALSGHVYLDPNGRAAYLADGVQIVGRGVGHWATNGEMVAMELDVYQYAAAAAMIPEKPHRFRGVFELNGIARGPQQGDWFACPEGEAPRLVGGLDVAKDTMELLPLAMQSSAAAGPAPRVAVDQRNTAMAALDAQHDLRATPPGVPWQVLAPYKVGSIPEIHYVPNWISKEEEAEFFHIADGDMRQWEDAPYPFGQDMRTRSSQEWGAGDRCTCGRGLMRMPLPESQQKLADALHQLGIFDAALYPMNSVRINGYRPGVGIFPHCDGPVYYPKVWLVQCLRGCRLPALFSLFYAWTPTVLSCSLLRNVMRRLNFFDRHVVKQEGSEVHVGVQKLNVSCACGTSDSLWLGEAQGDVRRLDGQGKLSPACKVFELKFVDLCEEHSTKAHEEDDKKMSAAKKRRAGLNVPKTFNEMFLFNACLMGYEEAEWMDIILDRMDCILCNVAQLQRLQVECDLISLIFTKYHRTIDISDYRVVLLATLRSLVKGWSMDMETAWNWFWDRVESMLTDRKTLGSCAKKLRTELATLNETHLDFLKRQIFHHFFHSTPKGQETNSQRAAGIRLLHG
eukprot:g30198.t1